MHPIKQALLDYSRIAGQADAALAEWERIEKAAPVAIAGFTGDIHVFKSKDIDACLATLDWIAKETK